jgi:hypothetical protein
MGILPVDPDRLEAYLPKTKVPGSKPSVAAEPRRVIRG